MGGAAYVFCLLGWFWSAILYFPALKLMLDKFAPYYPDVARESNLSMQVGGTNVVFALGGIVITLAMIGLTIYILAKFPITLAKAGKKIVHNPAEIIAPLITKHKHQKDTPKQRRIIAYRLTMLFKILLITLPPTLTIFSQLIDQPLDINISVIISSSLSAVAGMFFVLQMLLANIWHLDRSEVW